MLYGMKPNDPVTLAATTLVMLAITVMAAMLPAVRAARVDAMWVLRYE
jgi:ABC-type lipoprotein release transport system permease subunit